VGGRTRGSLSPAAFAHAFISFFLSSSSPEGRRKRGERAAEELEVLRAFEAGSKEFVFD
jgi:hypothetical protein